MAPSNLNQVFVVNDIAMLTGTSFNVPATAANGTKLGIWNIDPVTTGSIAANTYTVTAINDLKRFQLTQTTLGNVIATPIIDVADIVRINYNGFAADVQTTPIQTWTPGTIVANENVMVRIALRTSPTAYEYFANPANTNLDVVGSTAPSAGKKTFPLVGNFSAGRMIFNIEIPSTSTGTAAAACDYVKNAINANKTLDAIFNYNALAASTLALTARHIGVEFDLTVSYSDGSAGSNVGTVVGTRFTPTSNYVQAISDEKSQRARYGNFNRMYFPVAQTDFAQPGYAYDMVEISYRHGHPSSTGIARAGELNTVKIYFGSSSTPLAAAANFVTAFGITTIGTDVERVEDTTLQS
jgi:hypothetical protein